jgi:hypothetical protein
MLFDVMRCLANLLRFDAAEEKNPAIRSRPIPQPIFITGLPRSATTFLHTLLSLDPQNAVPRCWRLLHPYPPTSLVPAALCKMHVKMLLGLFHCLTPGLTALHPLSADMPQECTDITGQIFQSLRFETTHRVPSYQSWLESHGHQGASTGASSSIWSRWRRAAAGSSSHRITSSHWMPSARCIRMRRSSLCTATRSVSWHPVQN